VKRAQTIWLLVAVQAAWIALLAWGVWIILT
jgi:hypothetical protein